MTNLSQEEISNILSEFNLPVASNDAFIFNESPSERLLRFLSNATVPCLHGVFGYDYAQICRSLFNGSYSMFTTAKHRLRLSLGEDSSQSLVIHQCGNSQLYHLSDNWLEGVRWQDKRVKKDLSDARINVAHWESMVRACVVRGAHGDIARTRRILRSHQRHLEDLQSFLEDL